MSDIIINSPIYFKLSFLEIDENLPSLKIELHLINDGLKGKYDLKINFWILVKNWEIFYNCEILELIDLDNIVRLKIITEYGKKILEINPTFKSNMIKMECNVKAYITNDELESILKKFKEYSQSILPLE